MSRITRTGQCLRMNIAPTPTELELQRATLMLTSEHAALQSARATNVAEATGRTLLFVSVTSAVIFGLGLLAQIAQPSRTFIALALLLLPGLCVLGVETFIRVLVLLVEDETYARAIDHVRRYYLDWAPSTRPYLFIAPGTTSENVLVDLDTRFTTIQRVTTSANLVGIVTSMLVGLLSGLVAFATAGGRADVAMVCGFTACSLGIVSQALAQHWTWRRAAVCWERRVASMHAGVRASPRSAVSTIPAQVMVEAMLGNGQVRS
jgi:hypothetical protein